MADARSAGTLRIDFDGPSEFQLTGPMMIRSAHARAKEGTWAAFSLHRGDATLFVTESGGNGAHVHLGSAEIVIPSGDASFSVRSTGPGTLLLSEYSVIDELRWL